MVAVTQSRSAVTQYGRHTGLVAIGVAATSAGGLAFEIALTRVFAIAQFYHFAFLSVSLALLGFGASGSALAAFPRLADGGPRRWARLAEAQSIATVGAYLVANLIPFDSFAIAVDRIQILYFGVYYLALTVPFFFGGMVVAILLQRAGDEAGLGSHRVYAASLVGSGLGAGLALAALDWLGGERTIVVAAAVVMAGAVALRTSRPGTSRTEVRGSVLATVLLVSLTVWLPGPLEMRLSAYKDLTAALRYPGAEVTITEWDLGTRIDLVTSGGIRSVPGLSLTYTGALPRQDALAVDGDDLSPIPRAEPDTAEFADHVLGSVAFRLRPGADVLVLEPGGGLDVVVALANGAQSVTTVGPHPDVFELTRSSDSSPYDDDRVTAVVASARSFIERTDEAFDVIDLALTTPNRTVASGAYSLAEDYRLTVEAFQRYLDRLAPGGIFTATRWVQTPASEETRLLATVVEALDRRGVEPRLSVVMLRSYSNAVVLASPDGFAPSDLNAIEAFADAERFDIVTAPGSDPSNANRYNVVPDEQYSGLASDLITAQDRAPIYASHPFAIEPATDDHPFFGHYFTWSQSGAVLDSLGRTWQPFGGAGFFVLIALLLISALAAAVLIALPLLIRRRTRAISTGTLRWWTLGYFGLLGVGFLFIEIPLIQQFILLVGRPATAFAAVVFAILISSGVGSATSKRIPWRTGALLLVGAAALYPLFVRAIIPLLLPTPAWIRLAAAALIVSPLGFLMGIMFPHGLARLEEWAPGLVPWAWGINGTFSVISSVAAALLSLGFGFSLVVQAGAGAYLGAALLSGRR